MVDPTVTQPAPADPDTASQNHLLMDETITIDDIQQLMSDLRRLAVGLLAGDRGAHSVSPTALVLTGLRRYRVGNQGWSDISWNDRHHCLGSLHLMMRRALVDHARKKAAQKRPAISYLDPTDVNFYDLVGTVEKVPEQVIALEEALAWLGQRDAELAQIIECHYFSGLSVQELAAFLEISTRTVKRKLTSARLLLHGRILELLSPPDTAHHRPNSAE